MWREISLSCQPGYKSGAGERARAVSIEKGCPMPRRFVTLDVFTDKAFAGNPLAVVLDAEGLDTDAMQRIAGEFNLSETVFVLPPADSHQRADIRIFTPARELPFAGHPTVGTAVLLALLDQEGRPGAVAFGLREKVGIVPCAVEVQGEREGKARFRLPRLPFSWGEGKESADCAWALGLDPTEIGFDRHLTGRHSAGVAYDLVPVASLEALAKSRPQGEAFDKVFGDSDHPAAYVYARVPQAEGLRFRARMYGPGMGIAEDPATGSAAAAFAGALMQCEPLGDGVHNIVIEQGVEMGRPSEILLQLVITNGALVSAEIGGNAVLVSRGEILS
jgi:trans-2,3-dihydro-3-hydroxyanthranilate isomerase